MESATADLFRIAVPGGRGMLGTDVVAALSAAGFQPVPLDLPEFDLCRTADVERAVRGADAVVNCAAYTNVDGAESHPATAEAVNATAVGRLGEIAARHGRFVLHVSTDFVFDGTLDRPYTEADATNPVNVYGATKLAGEQALAASGCRSVIVRVQWTYGAAGNSFVSKLLSRARAGAELNVVADQVGSPTWTRDVAAALLALAERSVTGLYHYAAAGYATRFEVAAQILQECGLDCRLAPCRTSDFPAAAARPLNSRFDCHRIDVVLGASRPDWRQALQAFLHQTGLARA